MPYSDAQKKATAKYKDKNYKRVPLDISKEKYAEIKAHAVERSETVNGFIKRAIDCQIQRDNEDNPE